MESLSWNRTPDRTSSRSQLRHPSPRLGDSGILEQGSHLNPLLDPIVRFDADQDVSCTGATLDSCAIGAMEYKILRPNQNFARRFQCFCSATASCPDHSLSWFLNLSGIAHSRFSMELRNRLSSRKCCMTWECLSQISFLARKPHRTRICIHVPHSGRLVASRDRKRLAHDAQGRQGAGARRFRFGGKKEPQVFAMDAVSLWKFNQN
jgi:hypothetical protein